MYDLLRMRAQGLTGPALDFARELIETPSLSLQELRASVAVEWAMRELDYDRVVRDDYGNVLGVIFGVESGPTLLLISHMDTVRPQPGEEWTNDPYSAVESGGRLQGLGAADCKGGLAAQLYAGAALKRSLLPLRGNLVVAATVAEENGLALGVRALLKETLPQLGLVPEYAVLGEPTNLGLYYGHEGWLELDLNISGRDAFQVIDAGSVVFEELFAGEAPHGEENVRQDVDVSIPQTMWENGGCRSLLRVRRRLLQGQGVESVVAQLERSASQATRTMGWVGVDVDVSRQKQCLCTGKTWSIDQVSRPWSTDPFDGLVQRARNGLAAAGCKVRPAQWQLDRLKMGTAGGALVTEFKIPTIGFGPGDEKQAHRCNEFVEIEKLEKAIYGTAAIAHSLIGVPVVGWCVGEI